MQVSAKAHRQTETNTQRGSGEPGKGNYLGREISRAGVGRLAIDFFEFPVVDEAFGTWGERAQLTGDLALLAVASLAHARFELQELLTSFPTSLNFLPPFATSHEISPIKTEPTCQGRCRLVIVTYLSGETPIVDASATFSKVAFRRLATIPLRRGRFGSFTCFHSTVGWQSLVECTGLENRRTARYRGFESLPDR